MAEPQPSTVKEGDTTALQSAAGGKDDAKAAAALSSLDAPSGSSVAEAPKKEIDAKALGDAIAKLELASGSGAVGNKTAGKTTDATVKGSAGKKDDEPAKKVKIDAADVNVLVEACELSRVKATDLLRQHEGDLGRALRGWVGIGVGA